MDRKAALARWLRRALIATIAINSLWLVLIGAVYAVPLPKRTSDWSITVEYRDGQPAYVFLTTDEKWRLPVTLERVDPKYVDALIALEDKRFYSHVGVDPIAIARAAWTDVIARRRVSGGSTLSMQLARLLEPRPRTIGSKLIEMFRATQLDARLSKRQILENYLSRTPYGRNLEGIESAAWSYFGHGAQHLSPLEIATLLAVPQGPARYSPTQANAERLRERRDAILHKLIDAGVFSTADTQAALAEAIAVAPPTKMRPMPRNAPHAAVWLVDLARQAEPGSLRFGLSPGQWRIRSTLEAGAQKLAEHVVALHAPELQRKHIYNGAVVVVDHRTRDVVGLVGNLDFTDFKHGGQIAMFKRARSPGSTLKPLLYSLAIDRGLALPEYLVADVPVEYGTYRPHNFDGDFMGLVTLRESLARSLNVPFVELLQQLGVEPFIAELQRHGVSPARAKHGEYGLSLIAGGIELTPLEVASLYATLAEDGNYEPLRLRTDDKLRDPQSIYGAPAAHLTREALSLRDRPDFPKRRDLLHGVPQDIHWKTGTSFGYRDAWSVGSGPAYTVAVWTGNVDQTASFELVGSEAAGPLLFDVLEGLADRSRNAVPPKPPADLVDVEVCAYSGHVPTDACTHRAAVRAPLHSVPTDPCPYHDVCRAEGKPAQSYVALPSSVTAWLVERNRAVPEVPAACALATTSAPPTMMTPSEGQVITLIPGVPAKNQVVPLQASTRAGTVSWFVDGELVGSAAANERVYWTPSVGKHDVVVADESGRKARRKLVVQLGASQLR
jgi:penicillin-binding protein 1C